MIRPLVFLLNILVRIAGKALRLDHNLNKKFDTIAIAKYKGMGSIIQATPLIKALRDKYPDATLIFITSSANAQILREISDIDKIILLDDRSLHRLLAGIPLFVWSMIRSRIDVFIDLEIYAHSSAVFATLSLATNRLGYHLRGSRYRLGIYTHMIYYNPKAPMSEVYLQMGRLLYISDKEYPLESFDGAKHLPMGWSDQDYIILNVNASDLRLERRWSADNYIDLSTTLNERYSRKKLVFIGSQAERSYTDQIVSQIPFEVINVAGKTTISELIAIIRNASLMISNDTGPLHIAMAVNTPSIALFGPCSPTQYKIPDHVKVIYKNIYCSPCVHEFVTPPCNGNNTCMQEIMIDDVIELLDDKTAMKYQLPIVYKESNRPLGVIKRS